MSWDNRHSKATSPITACELLLRHKDLLPETGTALDLACGRGGNTIELARHGMTVTACDNSKEAIKILKQEARQKLPEKTSITTTTKPAETVLKRESNSYDLIIVSRFLDRNINTAITAALKKNGLLFYQTFTEDSSSGPSNPDYILQRNELLRIFSNKEYMIIHYQEYGILKQEYNYAELVARKK